MKNERVVVIGDLAAHEFHFRLDDLLHIRAHPLGIVVSLAIDNDPVWYPLNFKRERFEITSFNRRIVENIEVLSTKSILRTRRYWQSGCDLPRFRRKHMESRRRI